MYFLFFNQDQVYQENLGSLDPQALAELRVKRENEQLKISAQWDLMDLRENLDLLVIRVLKDYQVSNVTMMKIGEVCQSWQLMFNI